MGKAAAAVGRSRGRSGARGRRPGGERGARPARARGARIGASAPPGADGTARAVRLTVDGREVRVAAGTVVAAAVAAAGLVWCRRSVRGEPRGPLCGMGVCHECRVTVDGRAHRLACQVVCAEGMRVETA